MGRTLTSWRMAALQNPIDRGPEAPSPVKHSHRTARNRYFEFLDLCRSVVGLPTAVAMVLTVLFHTDQARDQWIVQSGTVIALAIAIFLRFFPKLKPWTVIPLLLGAVLALVLTLFVAPRRAQKQSNLMANRWLAWQQKLEDASEECSPAELEKANEKLRKANEELSKANKANKAKHEPEAPKTRDGCLSEKLTPVLAERPRPDQASDVTTLAGDLMAGQMMLANETTRSALDDRLGVREKFLGTGRSEPVGGKDYKDAGVRGYLVPNLSDKNSDVWIWKAEDLKSQKQIMEQNLLHFLSNTAPQATTPDHQNVKDTLARLKPNSKSNDPRPILIRFALIPQPKPYSNCLGRSKATRVHMHNLDDLKDRTVGEAAQRTGWTEPEKLDEPGQRLFIWVYAPEVESPAVAATWGNVLANFGNWITAEDCEHPK